MSAARILACWLLLAGAGDFAFGQTGPSGGAVNPPADPSPASGPVVMPPGSPSGPVIMPPTNPGNPVVMPAAAPNATASAPPPGSVSAGPKQDEIYDIRPPLFFLGSWLWLWILLAAVAVLALALFLWRWFGGRSADQAKTAYDLALEKLEKARLLISEDNPAPYAVAVSEAIRVYLGQRFHSSSARRTTEEFLRQMQGNSYAPLAEHRDLLGEFLQSCDLVKFARYQPTLDELEKVQQRAVTFVTATKPAPVNGHPNGVTA